MENIGREDARIFDSYGGNLHERSHGESFIQLVKNRFGRGAVLHFGGVFTCETVDALLGYTAVRAPWADRLSLPETCELAVRQGKAGNECYVFVLNFSWQAEEIALKAEMVDADTGCSVQGAVRLQPFETRVFCCQSNP